MNGRCEVGPKGPSTWVRGHFLDAVRGAAVVYWSRLMAAMYGLLLWYSKWMSQFTRQASSEPAAIVSPAKSGKGNDSLRDSLDRLVGPLYRRSHKLKNLHTTLLAEPG